MNLSERIDAVSMKNREALSDGRVGYKACWKKVDQFSSVSTIHEDSGFKRIFWNIIHLMYMVPRGTVSIIYSDVA